MSTLVPEKMWPKLGRMRTEHPALDQHYKTALSQWSSRLVPAEGMTLLHYCTHLECHFVVLGWYLFRKLGQVDPLPKEGGNWVQGGKVEGEKKKEIPLAPLAWGRNVTVLLTPKNFAKYPKKPGSWSTEFEALTLMGKMLAFGGQIDIFDLLTCGSHPVLQLEGYTGQQYLLPHDFVHCFVGRMECHVQVHTMLLERGAVHSERIPWMLGFLATCHYQRKKGTFTPGRLQHCYEYLDTLLNFIADKRGITEFHGPPGATKEWLALNDAIWVCGINWPMLPPSIVDSMSMGGNKSGSALPVCPEFKKMSDDKLLELLEATWRVLGTEKALLGGGMVVEGESATQLLGFLRWTLRSGAALRPRAIRRLLLVMKDLPGGVPSSLSSFGPELITSATVILEQNKKHFAWTGEFPVDPERLKDRLQVYIDTFVECGLLNLDDQEE